MKVDDFDYGLKFKKKKTSDISFILRIIVIIFAVLIMFYLFFFIRNISSDNSYEISRNGEKYGTSEFIKYQGQIYVSIPSDGMYVLNDVDVESFKPLNAGDYYSRIIGLDKNHVYFGNITIPDLNPDTFYYIGNGYYSDGINTYFCWAYSEKNEELSMPMKLIQMFTYSSSKNKKLQLYIYPYKKIETDKKLQAVKNLYSFATDGEKVYYKGEVLENADLSTLKNVDGYNEYFVDKENVYYKSKLLPIKNSGKLIVVSSEQGDEFLYDEANGYVFLEDYSFDREKAPYKVLGNKGNHLYNLIFVANDGIYYYDNQKKEQLKVSDNIFTGNVEQISPNVFSDDKNIYYFSAYSVRSGSRKNLGELLSRNTDIYYLDKKDGWEKVKDIRDGSIGNIWKKGNKYYYFNNLGIFHFLDDTIYEISDKETLNYLLSKADDETDDINSEGLIPINTDYIRELIKNEKLIAVSGEKKMTITIKYKTDIVDKIFKYSIRIFLVVYLIFVIFKIFRESRR